MAHPWRARAGIASICVRSACDTRLAYVITDEVISFARLSARLLYPSTPPPRGRTGTAVEVTRTRAGWKYINFAVRQIAPAASWSSNTGADECCLVLLQGKCRVVYQGGEAMLGPRSSVFAEYPHAIYLPRRMQFTVVADEATEVADGRAPARKTFTAQAIRPVDCGFEIRGGGNATRQIIDIMPPSFPADRLMLCEVLTPSGNWSSYPPHKHDADRPPTEVKLEEIYYYRFSHPEAYGFQRLYGRNTDVTLTVKHGDVVAVRHGYHPFVTAYGYNAYYLNVLAGTRRSMAASDDPRYAALRAWPTPDTRVPLIPRPPSADGGLRPTAAASRRTAGRSAPMKGT
jgi:5-deoxy-glucuronate isomerase